MSGNTNSLGSERFDHQQNYPEGGVGKSSPASLGNKPEGATRMWAGGPLRQFSRSQVTSHYKAYSGRFLRGYAGSYVCDGCQVPCAGIYRGKLQWLCGGCREETAKLIVRPKKAIIETEQRLVQQLLSSKRLKP